MSVSFIAELSPVYCCLVSQRITLRGLNAICYQPIQCNDATNEEANANVGRKDEEVSGYLMQRKLQRE